MGRVSDNVPQANFQNQVPATDNGPLPIITVSTDGSCLVNPGGAWGWAWVDHNSPKYGSGGGPSGTNQIGELTAVLEAIKAHPGPAPLLIESDSQYAIKCASEWLPGWKAKGWRTASGGPVKNLELVQAIDQAITERSGPVKFHWVRGHIGHKWNERADELAGFAARDWAAGRGEHNGALFTAPTPAVAAAARESTPGSDIFYGETTPGVGENVNVTPKHLKSENEVASSSGIPALKPSKPVAPSPSESLVGQILAPLNKKPRKSKPDQPTLF